MLKKILFLGILSFFGSSSTAFCEPINLENFPKSQELATNISITPGEFKQIYRGLVSLISTSTNSPAKKSLLGINESNLFLRDLPENILSPISEKLSFIIPPKGEELFYEKIIDKKQSYMLVVYVNGRKGPDFDENINSTSTGTMISPDGKKIIYMGCNNLDPKHSNELSSKNCFLVIADSKHDQIIPLSKFIDKKMLLYRAFQICFLKNSDNFFILLHEASTAINSKKYVIWNADPQKTFQLSELVLPDLKSDIHSERNDLLMNEFAQAGLTNGKKYVYVNGVKTSTAYDKITCINREIEPFEWKCLGTKNKNSTSEESWLIKKGQEIICDTHCIANSGIQNKGPFPVIDITSLPLTGKIKEIFTQGNNKQGAYVLINDKRYGPYEYVEDFNISPDGNHFAFKASQKSKNKNLEHFFFVVDGVIQKLSKGDAMNHISNPFTFSPDGTRWFYQVGSKLYTNSKTYSLPSEGGVQSFFIQNKWLLWIRPDQECSYGSIHEKACQTTKIPFSYLWFDGKNISGEAPVLSSPELSKDGKKVGYLKLQGNALWWMVQDLK